MLASTRAAIYLRVSSAGQEDNYSLATQEAACRALATERGWEVVGVYTDVHTRVELWERPHLTALREAVRRHEVDTVICYAIDRLSGDPVHLGVILSEADHAGADVVFVTEPLDDTPEGQLIRFVRGYAAKVEHEKIKERTMRGKLARVQSGKPAVGPRPPYGYRWADDRDKDGKPVKHRLEENSATAPIVQRIFREIASGLSARRVAISLSTEGIPTPTGNQNWVTATITQMLRNPIYGGDPRAHRYHRERVRGQKVWRGGRWVDGRGWHYSRRDEEETLALPDAAPALVAPELAAAAAARLTVNKQVSTRNNRNPESALFRGGYAVCGYCGGHLQAITHRTNGTHYRCNQANRDAHGCPGFSIKAHILDTTVWHGIRERLLNRDKIAAELQRLRREDPTQADVAALDRRVAEVQRKQRNLMARLGEEDNPDIAALIRADLASNIAEHQQLKAATDDLQRQREGWRAAQARLDELDLWVQNVAANLDDFDYAKKRLALSECQVQVRVWANDHAPRWHATMHLGSDEPDSFMDTTSRD